MPDLTGSLSLGYGWEQAAQTSAGCLYNQNGFQALVHLAWSPDTHTRVLSSYDSRSQTGRHFRHPHQRDAGRRLLDRDGQRGGATE